MEPLWVYKGLYVPNSKHFDKKDKIIKLLKKNKHLNTLKIMSFCDKMVVKFDKYINLYKDFEEMIR